MLQYLNEREEPDEAEGMLAQDLEKAVTTASLLANGSSGHTLAEQVYFYIRGVLRERREWILKIFLLILG